MAKVNVKEFAAELKLPVSRLLEQLASAGVKKDLTEETSLTETDKTKLLDFLKKSLGDGKSKSKITLKRRQTTEIKKSDSAGRSRTIQVEVRKKRVVVKKSEPVAEKKEAIVVKDPAPLNDVSTDPKSIEQAKRELEAKRQAELRAIQAAEILQKEADKKERQEKKETAAQEAESAKKEEIAAKAKSSDKKPVDTTLHSPITKDEAKKGY
jgi:translation initiation factor IF-2